jgi:hypothetical protein
MLSDDHTRDRIDKEVVQMPADLVSVPLDQLICRFYRVSEMPLIHLACEHHEGMYRSDTFLNPPNRSDLLQRNA